MFKCNEANCEAPGEYVVVVLPAAGYPQDDDWRALPEAERLALRDAWQAEEDVSAYCEDHIEAHQQEGCVEMASSLPRDLAFGLRPTKALLSNELAMLALAVRGMT